MPRSVLVVGAGPAGLNFSAQLKKREPDCRITVVERRAEDDFAGWGITLPISISVAIGCPREAIHRVRSYHLLYGGKRHLESTLELWAVAREAVMRALREQCARLGVDLRHGVAIEREEDLRLSDFDLVVAADGGNSLVRDLFREHFQPRRTVSELRFSWLGAERANDGMVATFEPADEGLYSAWAYPYSDTRSTFIVELTGNAWRKAGFEHRSEREALDHLARLFPWAKLLPDQKLLWRTFTGVTCDSWSYRNIVLLGDAARTIHYSQGAGTVMAIQDGNALAELFSRTGNLDEVLQGLARRGELVRKQQASGQSYVNWQSRVMHAFEQGNPNAVVEEIAQREAARARPSGP
ncbi:MAG TPA: FAD-dependent monooxygenase [Myxococcaceae bacterium]|nr:FAD-dependent monooxygenase [Myxococcaceae bacterium]